MAAIAAAVTVFPCINGHQPRLCLLRHGVSAGKPSSISTRFHRLGSRARRLFPVAARSRREPTEAGVEEKDEPEFSLLTAMTTPHNEIVILDTTDSRILLLDASRKRLDEFASLPAIVPKGPIAMLGLGGGTAAHLMLDLWPSLELDGWEIDEIVIDKAREYLGLSILEKCNDAGGVLRVHVGDALSPDVAVPGGFAGIVVDLFADGEILPQLEEVSTWMQLGKKLMSNGRIMVNCGGTLDEDCSLGKRMDHVHVSSHGILGKNPTMEAMREAFSEVNWKKMEQGESLNFLALTGPLPDVDQWAQTVPEKLSSNVRQWKPCSSL
ncbi:hypothetical protein EJ110_NYTH29277 [Nymphaea thermarum]|nr:hypothetical protein EJ110_NYTH29277 [Nymphaea thermarum]